MIRACHLLFLLAFTAALADDSKLLVNTGGVEISVEDVRASLETLDARQLAAVREDKVLLEQVVRSFIAQHLVLNQALEKKWDEEPQVIARLKRVRDTALTQSYLESVAQPPAHYPDEDQLKAAYELRKPSLLVPRSYHMAQVFVPVAPTADAQVQQQAKEKIQAAVRSLPEGKNFMEIGWMTENQIQPEIRTKMPVLKSNTTSQPIRLDDGWHLLKVLETRESYTPALDQVRAQLGVTLRNERLRENTQAYLARLLKETPIVLNQAALERVLPAQGN